MASIQTGYLKTKNGTQLFTTVPHPIGAIYLSVDSTDPGKLFGGTWYKFSGGYLYGCVSSISNSSYTGSGTQSKASFTSGSTTLTVDQIPSHTHGMYQAHPWNNTETASYKLLRENTVYMGEYNVLTSSTGGGQGHTHTIPAHSHNVAYIGVFIWKRIA